MKKCSINSSKLLVVSCCIISFLSACRDSGNLSNEQLATLKDVYNTNDYFKLKEALDKLPENSNKEYLYYNAVVSNAFNKPGQSNEFIARLIRGNQSPDSLISNALILKVNNLVRLGKYEEAYQAGDLLIKNYSSVTDSSTIQDQVNQLLIWKGLSNASPMEVLSKGDTQLKLKKDKAGLDRIPIKLNGNANEFVLDTGANFSVIKRSEAEKNNLIIHDANFEVAGITGLKVESDVAIANEIILGNHIFRNVVFLVMNDEVLTFPQFDFSIEGIIGFPVLEAAKEIKILPGQNAIEIPEKISDYNLNNLAMDGFTPLVQFQYKGEDLIGVFDTGADNSSFYSVFTNKYKSEFNNEAFAEKELSQMGAGGVVTVKGFEVPSLSLSIGGKVVTIDTVRVFAEEINTGETRYANIGQDVISQFNKLVLNFESMTLIFE